MPKLQKDVTARPSESDAALGSKRDPDDRKDVTVFRSGDIEKMSQNLELDEPVPWGHMPNQNRAKMSRRGVARYRTSTSQIMKRCHDPAQDSARVVWVRTSGYLERCHAQGPGAAFEPRA